MKVEASEDEEGYILLRGQPPSQFVKERSQSRASSSNGCQQQQQQKRGGADQAQAGSETPVRFTTATGGSLSGHNSISGLSSISSSSSHQMHFRLKRKAKIEMEAFSLDKSSSLLSSLPGRSPSLTSELHSAVRAAAEIFDRKTGSGDQEALQQQMAFYNPWALKCHRDHLKKLGLLPLPSRNPATESATTAAPEEKEAVISKTSRSNPQTYLLLENLVSKYRRPCVLDLKVGARQYADDVSASKKQRKISKANNTTLSSLGLRLCGMQVYSNKTGRYTCHNKYYGRQLTHATFRATILQFFHPDHGGEVRMGVLDKLMAKLNDLRRVIESLDSFRFYTSSLLLTYDACTDSNPGSPDCLSPRSATNVASDQSSLRSSLSNYEINDVLIDGDEERDMNRVDLRIIDFANSTHSGMATETGGILHAGPDSGFLYGLEMLLDILQDIKDGKCGGGDDDAEDDKDDVTISGEDAPNREANN